MRRAAFHRRFLRGAGRLALGTVLLAGGAGLAGAALCGDDVDGQDVPCACGDVIVSNVVLGSDPVVSGPPCPADGLIVRAPDDGRGVVVDLNGRTLRGMGTGVGLRVISGGEDGARVTSSTGEGQIVGFEDGVVARGSQALGVIEDVVVADSRRDALRIAGRNFVIRRTVVRGAKRDGFSLMGRGFRVVETQASDCGRFGYSVMGDSGEIGAPGSGNVAERSGTAGFNIMGAGHALSDCLAAFGAKSGVHLQAVAVAVRGCRTHDNGGSGIEGMGTQLRLSGNEALRNSGDGIDVRGSGILDEGGNLGAHNRGTEEGRAAVQCAINGVPCSL